MRLWAIWSAFAASLLLAGAPASVDATGPVAFVRDIYRAYEGARAKGQPMADRPARRRLFTPSLAKLIDDDYEPAERRGEVGILNFDPFVKAQDFEVDAVAVRTEPTGPGRAPATVTYTNFGQPATTRLDLVQGRGGWRIDEIRWSQGGSLRQLFRQTS